MATPVAVEAAPAAAAAAATPALPRGDSEKAAAGAEAAVTPVTAEAAPAAAAATATQALPRGDSERVAAAGAEAAVSEGCWGSSTRMPRKLLAPTALTPWPCADVEGDSAAKRALWFQQT